MAVSDRLKVSLTLIILQVIFVILFVVCVDYDESASPELIPAKATGNGNEGGASNGTIDNGGEDDHGAAGAPGDKNVLHHYYPMFQDVHVMIFLGIGFLMVFLRRYGFSSVGFNMLIGAVAIQWSSIVSNLIHHEGAKVHLGVTTMLTADFAAATVLISFGAMLGKTTPLQMIVITLLEIVLFSINEYIGLSIFKVVDVGGSMFVHAFGAYFGLTVSRVIYREGMDSSNKEGSIYHSDLFSMVGTVFLWLFWPSFNAAFAVEDAQHRAVLNTYLALAACCVVTFALSQLVDKNGKFDMVHVQNATLAGGVAVGTTADMMIHPFGALIIGCIAALVSVIGYKYITPLMAAKLKIHDTCGIHNLHGMPAVVAAVIGALVVSLADQDTYGYTLFRQFPAMAPNKTSPEWDMLEGHVDRFDGEGRSAGEQAGYQILALVVTVVFAIVGGLLVGFIIRFSTFLGQPSGPQLFEDTLHWHVPDDPQASDMVNDVITELDKRGRNANTSLADHSLSPLLEEKSGSNGN